MLATIGNHRVENKEKEATSPVRRSAPAGRGTRPPGHFQQDAEPQDQMGPEANISDAHMSLSGCQAGADSNCERFAPRKEHGCDSSSLPARQATGCVTHGDNKAETAHRNGDNVSEDFCREGQTRMRDRGYTSRAVTSVAEHTRTQRELAPGWGQVCDSFKDKSGIGKCAPESSLSNPTFTCDTSYRAGKSDVISGGSVTCGGDGSLASRRYSDVGVSRLRLALQTKTPLESLPSAGNGLWSSPLPDQGGSEVSTAANLGTYSGNRVTEDGTATIPNKGPDKEETLAEARVNESVRYSITRLHDVERAPNHQSEARLPSEPEENGVEKDSATKRIKEQEETEPGVLGVEIVDGESEDLWLEQSLERSSTESLIDVNGGSEDGSDSNVPFSSSPGSSSWEGDAGGVTGRHVRRAFTPPSSAKAIPFPPLPPLPTHIPHPAEGDYDGVATSHCTASDAPEAGADLADNTRELYPSATAKPLTSAVVLNKSAGRRKSLRQNRVTYHSGATAKNAEIGRAEICAVLGGVPRYKSGGHSGCSSRGEKAGPEDLENSDGSRDCGDALDVFSDEEHQERVGGIKKRSNRRSCRPAGTACRGSHTSTPTRRDVSDVSDLSSKGFDDREGDFSEYHRGEIEISLASHDGREIGSFSREPEIIPVRGEPGSDADFEAWNTQPPGKNYHEDAKTDSPSIDPRPCGHANRWEDSPSTRCEASPGNVDAQQQIISDSQHQHQQQEEQHQELKPRITELFRATLTSTSSSDTSSGSAVLSLECARGGLEGEEEASLAISLGSNDTADTFAEMQVSAASSMELRYVFVRPANHGLPKKACRQAFELWETYTA